MTSMQTMTMNAPQAGESAHQEQASLPWWRYPLMWLVVGGPALVVMAAIVTAWIAMRDPDPVVDPDYYRKGIEINATLEQRRALAPAQQGRNHATTPTADMPLAKP